MQSDSTYYDINFCIPAQNLTDAYEALWNLKVLQTREDLMSCVSTQEVLWNAGFIHQTDSEGNLHLIDLRWDPTGQEEQFLAAIAPLAEPGWSVRWFNADGSHHRWVADEQGQLITQRAMIRWP